MVNLVAAGLIAGLIALPLGIPALQAAHDSFVMCTLGFVIIAQTVAKNWIGLTRGDMGLSGIPKPKIALGPASFTISRIPRVLLSDPGCRRPGDARLLALVSSPAGRSMVAIRENETLAESVGIPTWSYKLIVFMLSAVFAGLGGSLYAHYLDGGQPAHVPDVLFDHDADHRARRRRRERFPGVVIGSFLFVALSEALRVAPNCA